MASLWKRVEKSVTNQVLKAQGGGVNPAKYDALVAQWTRLETGYKDLNSFWVNYISSQRSALAAATQLASRLPSLMRESNGENPLADTCMMLESETQTQLAALNSVNNEVRGLSSSGMNAIIDQVRSKLKRLQESLENRNFCESKLSSGSNVGNSLESIKHRHAWESSVRAYEDCEIAFEECLGVFERERLRCGKRIILVYHRYSIQKYEILSSKERLSRHSALETSYQELLATTATTSNDCKSLEPPAAVVAMPAKAPAPSLALSRGAVMSAGQVSKASGTSVGHVSESALFWDKATFYKFNTKGFLSSFPVLWHDEMKGFFELDHCILANNGKSGMFSLTSHRIIFQSYFATQAEANSSTSLAVSLHLISKVGINLEDTLVTIWLKDLRTLMVSLRHNSRTTVTSVMETMENFIWPAHKDWVINIVSRPTPVSFTGGETNAKTPPSPWAVLADMKVYL
jgi:hypothetical protein